MAQLELRVVKLVILVTLLSTLTVGNPRPFQEYGVVSSPNKTFRFVGDTLELYCNITNKNVRENSSMLYFERNTSKDHTSSIIPAENVKILTTKAIRLTLRNLDIDDDGAYTCLQRQINGDVAVIGHQVIKVDYMPKKVENITCRVYNWERMKCTWDLGQQYNHPENINVSMAWTIFGQQRDCQFLTQTSCEWNETVYQHGHQYIMRVEVMTVVNGEVLDSVLSETFKIETKLYESHGMKTEQELVRVIALVEPAPVNNLRVTSINSTCLYLTWQHPSSELRKKHFIAEYRKAGEDNWSRIIVPEMEEVRDHSALQCELTPFTEYEVRMSVLPYPVSTSKPGKQGHRSDYRMTTATTLEDVPGAPPSLCPGCFYDLKCSHNKDHRCVRLYWQDLDGHEKHGILTNYLIKYTATQKGQNGSKIVPMKADEAVLSVDLELPRHDLDYNITVTPATRQGYSEKSSSLYLPSVYNRPEVPDKFLVERDNEDKDKLKFYLSWAAVAVDRQTSHKYSSVTIVWCVGKLSRVECLGDIHWKILPADQVTFELEPEVTDIDLSDLMIGISGEVNHLGRIASSGVSWSSCVYMRNQVPENTPKDLRLSSSHPGNSLIVLWDRFECGKEKAFITEYIVKYCPSYEGKMCHEKEMERNVSNTDTEVTLTELKADTKYKVTVIAVSAAGLGPAGKLFSSTVESVEPEPGDESNLWIIIVIFVALLLIILAIACWRYCMARRKKVPRAEGLIQPYAETKACPSKKHQDFRNRPLPKTPEDQHFYGSSACMNNPGSNKDKQFRHSESSSEHSVTSETNLIPAVTFNGQSPLKVHGEVKSNGHAKRFSGHKLNTKGATIHEIEKLLNPDKSEVTERISGREDIQSSSADSSVSDYRKIAECSNTSGEAPKLLSNTSGGTRSSEDTDEYHVLGVADNSSTSGIPADRNVTYDLEEVELSMQSTLSLRDPIRPLKDCIVYPAAPSVHSKHSLDSLVSSQAGSRIQAPGVSYNNDMKAQNQTNCPIHNPSNTADIPSVTHDNKSNSPGLNSDYVTASPDFALPPPSIPPRQRSDAPPDQTTHENSNVRERPVDKRRSMLLSSVLQFPPPPNTPPSPCPEDIAHQGFALSPVSSHSMTSTSSDSPDGAISPGTQLPISQQQLSNSYVPHSIPSQTVLEGDIERTYQPDLPQVYVDGNIENNLDYVPHQNTNLDYIPQTLANVDYVPHNMQSSSNYVPNTHASLDYLANNPDFYQQEGTNYVPEVNEPSLPQMPASATLPRPGSQNMSYLPNPALLSRPLSGVLLQLPEQYYRDQEAGSNQMLTEL